MEGIVHIVTSFSHLFPEGVRVCIIPDYLSWSSVSGHLLVFVIVHGHGKSANLCWFVIYVIVCDTKLEKSCRKAENFYEISTFAFAFYKVDLLPR